MKIIRFDRKSVAWIVLVAFAGLLFATSPLSAANGRKPGPAAAAQKGEAHGPGFIEQVKKNETSVRKHKKFPWWLAVIGGAVVAGVVVYILVAKGSGSEPEDEDVGIRRVVLAEQFTATWCGYCPGAAMGLDQVKDENPATLAVIAYHNTDDFYNSAIYNARKSFYGVGGIPDVFFDGKERQTGGSATQSMYSSYKPIYDRRAAVLSPLELQLVGQGGNTVRVEMRNVSNRDIAGTFHFLIVEDDIPFIWQNQNMLRFVCRSMLPGPAGESVSLAFGETKSVTRTYTIANDWNRANCHIVAFFQGGDKEIYQGIEAILPN